MSKHKTEHQRNDIIFTFESSGITYNELNTLRPQATVTQTFLIQKEDESVASYYNKFQANCFMTEY